MTSRDFIRADMVRGRKSLPARAHEAAIRAGDRKCPYCGKYFSLRGGVYTRHTERCQESMAHSEEVTVLRTELQALRAGKPIMHHWGFHYNHHLRAVQR